MGFEKTFFYSQFPSRKEILRGLPDSTFLFCIFDKRLKKDHSSFLDCFDQVYPVLSGESLKSLESFSFHIENITELLKKKSTQQLCFVSLGGGSVGDFCGFISSVYKRGVRLIHIPSTWLAALDSTHGGKTALNIKGFKNQIGTFHFPAAIHICKTLLWTDPQLLSALGELIKIALINNRTLFKNIETSFPSGKNLKEREALKSCLWNHLKPAIESKYQVVSQDPLEKRGGRQVLNLGHSLGHIIEAFRKLPHGEAVAQGLYFALAWSKERKKIKPEAAQRVGALLDFHFEKKNQSFLTLKELMSGLQKDKKRSDSFLNFIFIQDIGETKAEKVSLDHFVKETHRQGWCQPQKS